MHIISADLWAGAEVQVYHTLCHLHKVSSFSFIVILFNKGLLSEKLQKENIHLEIFDEKEKNNFEIFNSLRKIIIEAKPKIIHVHGYKEQVLGQIARLFCDRNTKIIRTFHGMSETPEGLSLLKKFKSKMIHKIEKWFLRNAYIVAVSKDLEFYLRSHYPESHIRQIYNSIPINNIHVDRDIVRQKFNVKPKSLWIASVARLEKPKNLDLLIDAGKRLFEQGIDIRVSIFGIGPLKKYLENKIDQNGLNSCIKLEGFVEDIFPVLKSIDIFTLTSFHEGLPMSLLEALSVETAVVCTSVGGMKEIITNGYSGILVKSNNAAELSDAFLNLNTDTVKREKIGQNGRQEIIKKFAIEITNQKLIRFYNDLLLDN